MSRPEQLAEQMGRDMADAKEFQVPQDMKRTKAYLCLPGPCVKPPCQPPPCRPPCSPCVGPR